MKVEEDWVKAEPERLDKETREMRAEGTEKAQGEEEEVGWGGRGLGCQSEEGEEVSGLRDERVSLCKDVLLPRDLDATASIRRCFAKGGECQVVLTGRSLASRDCISILEFDEWRDWWGLMPAPTGCFYTSKAGGHDLSPGAVYRLRWNVRGE